MSEIEIATDIKNKFRDFIEKDVKITYFKTSLPLVHT